MPSEPADPAESPVLMIATRDRDGGVLHPAIAPVPPPTQPRHRVRRAEARPSTDQGRGGAQRVRGDAPDGGRGLVEEPSAVVRVVEDDPAGGVVESGSVGATVLRSLVTPHPAAQLSNLSLARRLSRYLGADWDGSPGRDDQQRILLSPVCSLVHPHLPPLSGDRVSSGGVVQTSLQRYKHL